MDPEFEQQSAFVAEHLLVLAYGLHVRMETVVVDLAAPTRCFAHRFVVPGVEKDSELALGRKRTPIPPRRRSLRLLGRARTERDDADMTRIHPFGQLVRGFAAAARVNPRKNDQNRAAPGLGKIELRVPQRLAQRRLLASIGLLRDLVTYFRRFEHGSSAYRQCQNGLALTNLRQARSASERIDASAPESQPRTMPTPWTSRSVRTWGPSSSRIRSPVARSFR